MEARLIPDFLKSRIAGLPDRPGVYLFKDRGNHPIYIGKALSLRKRVMGHFRCYGESFTKEGVMLAQVKRIDVIETPTEAEALLLESCLVKESLPTYNQDLGDDRKFPSLKITGEEYPRLLVVRTRKADGGKYFGPYTSAYLLHQAVKMLRQQFPLRICRTLPKKVCLAYHLGQCGGPCEGFEARAHYRHTVKELESFLEGRRDALVRNLMRRMKEHSSKREYEKAQTILGEIQALSSVPASGPRARGEGTLGALQEALELPHLPVRMECFDISNIMGQEAVGSMVVFVNGEPARSDYRRFRIKTVKGIDDYSMMREVIRRRYGRATEETTLPDLVVIDGGKGHLGVVKAELDALGLTELPVVSIAKQHEHLFKPGREMPYVFPLSSPFLHLVRHLRDEAHRFAISYHRRLHKKEAIVSLLDAIPGVGPATRAKLLKKAGSVKKIAAMNVEELMERGQVSEKTARRILESLAPASKIW